MNPCLSLLFEMLVMSAEPIYPEKTDIRAYLETLEEWGRLSRGMIVKKDQLNLKYMPKLRNAVKMMESQMLLLNQSALIYLKMVELMKIKQKNNPTNITLKKFHKKL